MRNEKILKELKVIVDICQDGAEGYDKAANEIENSELKTVFNRLSQQRRRFAEELRNDSKELGAMPDAEGTLPGYFHQRWIDVKSKLTDRDDDDLIEEAKNGEKAAITAYDQILEAGDIPDFIQKKLADQKKMIEGAYKQLQDFKVESA